MNVHFTFSAQFAEIIASFLRILQIISAENAENDSANFRKVVQNERRPHLLPRAQSCRPYKLLYHSLAQKDILDQSLLPTTTSTKGRDNALFQNGEHGWAVYVKEKNFAKAEPLYEQALKILKGLEGQHSVDIVQCLISLGTLHSQMGDQAKAEQSLRDALETCSSMPASTQKADPDEVLQAAATGSETQELVSRNIQKEFRRSLVAVCHHSKKIGKSRRSPGQTRAIAGVCHSGICHLRRHGSRR